jgi:4-amino-4-deoxy-L-arabinose transferase-like glycosyltransferase
VIPHDPGPRGGVPWVCTPAGVYVLLIGWALVHVALRLGLSPVLTIDDAREAVLTQTLEWGYQARQPPLYNWLAWSAVRLLGPGVLAFTALKYALLVVAHGFVYATARRVLAGPCLAAAAGFSFLLVVPISWTFHEALTHSVAVYAACAATTYALVRLEASGGPWAYAGLGAALGAGALSKYTYVVFAAGMLGAALTLPSFRRRLLSPWILLTAAVATAVLLPFALWFADRGYDLWRLYAREVRVDDDASLRDVLHGLGYVLKVTTYYLGVPAAAFAWLFPRIYRSVPASPGAPGRLLGRHLAVVLLVLAGTALLGFLSFLKYRWLIPGFFLAPVYALWRAERTGVPPRRLAAYAALLVAAEVVVTGAILVSVFGSRLMARPYVLNEPYHAAAEEIGRAGFSTGTVVVGMGALAGSLRLRFPEARVLSLEHPYYRPPAREAGRCLVAWEERETADARRMPGPLRQFAEAVLEIPLPADEPGQLFQAPYRHETGRVRRIHYVLVPAAGACR